MNWNLTLDEDLLSRLKIVSDDLKDVFLNYYLSCSIAGRFDPGHHFR